MRAPEVMKFPGLANGCFGSGGFTTVVISFTASGETTGGAFTPTFIAADGATMGSVRVCAVSSIVVVLTFA